MNINKTWTFIGIALSLLLITVIYILSCNNSVKFAYLKTCSIKNVEFKDDVQLINSERNFLFDELGLKKYNIDFGKSTVLVSKGKVTKIKRIKKNKYFPVYTNYIEVYLTDLSQSSIHVYILPQNHVYFDDRCNISSFIKK